MCHAYSITTNEEALRQVIRAMFEPSIFDFGVADNIGNMAPQTGTYPDMLDPGPAGLSSRTGHGSLGDADPIHLPLPRRSGRCRPVF